MSSKEYYPDNYVSKRKFRITTIVLSVCVMLFAMLFVGATATSGSLEQDYEKLNGYYEKLEAAYQALTEENADLRDKYDSIREEIETYQNQQEKIDELTAQLTELQTQYDTLKSENEALKSEVSSLQTKTASGSSVSNSVSSYSDPGDYDSGGGTVWLSATGSKYHSIPDCGNMNPNKARQVTQSEAEAMGDGACKKCN